MTTWVEHTLYDGIIVEPESLHWVDCVFERCRFVHAELKGLITTGCQFIDCDL